MNAESGDQTGIFSKISQEQVCTLPFPHVALDGFLEADRADALAAGFPPLNRFIGMAQPPENKKFFLGRTALNEEPALDEVWKHFLGEVDDLRLHLEIERIFGESIKKYYPDFISRFGKIHEMSMAYRYMDQAQHSELKFDYKCAVHAPSWRSTTQERGPHCKGNDKLAEMHLFLRHPKDVDGDCDLVLHRKKGEGVLEFGERNQVAGEQLEEVSRIPYQTNRGLLFLNTCDSITEITPRCSQYPLQYFIIVFELCQPLFPL